MKNANKSPGYGSLQQNSKMKNATVRTYQFSLPAVTTCPGAGGCKLFCFALMEQKRYPSANAYRERMEKWTKSLNFASEMIAEVKRVASLRANKGRRLAIRIHASGDFYSPAYARAWTDVARAVPEVSFYAYTKSVALWKRLRPVVEASTGGWPSNFTLIYSMGGTMDSLINPETDRHSRIFSTVEALEAAGYVRADEDDTAAWDSPTTRIGLVMFGARARAGNELLGNAPAPRAPRAPAKRDDGAAA